jgi:dTMP kinase
MFITLEGPDGSGKSTQVQPLADFLRLQGYTVFTTREPGGTTIGDQVRNTLMRLDNQTMHPRTETLLFCAARAQLVEEEIRPRLKRNEIVISDRYADSTLAYQGYGHGNDLNNLRQLLNFATGNLWPDLTVLFDIDAVTGLNRRRTGGGEWNRLDDYQVAFHRRVREGYLEMTRLEPERWVKINAEMDIDSIQNELRSIVMNHIKKMQK